MASLAPSNGGGVALADHVMLAGEPETSDITAKFAMLPLGAETGRHIPSGAERSANPDSTRDQSSGPITEMLDQLHSGYAMLPLGSEAGRHIRNLDQDNRQPEKTVAANTPKATA